MNGLSPYMLQHIKGTYPPGTRVELVLRCDGNAGNSLPTKQGKDP